eukprot:2708655-Pyramimonas_sp.AAC.2
MRQPVEMGWARTDWLPQWGAGAPRLIGRGKRPRATTCRHIRTPPWACTGGEDGSAAWRSQGKG